MTKSHEDIATPCSSPETAAFRKTLIVSGGNKGGVGKSLVATTIASLLLARSQPITLIEADPTNPDIARRFAHHAPVLLADVGDRDGWIALLDALEAVTTPYIVVSLPAGTNEIDAIQHLLRRTLATLDIDLHLLFSMSRQHDSLELIGKSLTQGLASFAQQAVAIKNGFFGREEQFDRWNTSKYRKQWLNQGFAEAFLPELNHRIIDFLESHPQPLHHLASAGLSTALRLDLEDWLNAAQMSLMSIGIEGTGLREVA